MKKILITITCVIVSVAGYAQSSDVDSATNLFKPRPKSVVTELNFNPFNGNLNLNNSLNQIKIRYFVKESIALRLGFNVNTKDTVTNVSIPYGTQSNFNKNDKKSTTVGINFGVEKHFKGTKRLSPYIAGDISLSNRASSQKTTDNATTTTVKNGWIDYIYAPPGNYSVQAQQNAYFRYGVNFITGFDYYIAKNFFLGYEFNLSLAKTDWKRIEVVINNDNNNNSNNGYGKNSSLTFGTTLMNGIRLGYAF